MSCITQRRARDIPLPEAVDEESVISHRTPHVIVWDLDALMLAPQLVAVLLRDSERSDGDVTAGFEETERDDASNGSMGSAAEGGGGGGNNKSMADTSVDMFAAEVRFFISFDRMTEYSTLLMMNGYNLHRMFLLQSICSDGNFLKFQEEDADDETGVEGAMRAARRLDYTLERVLRAHFFYEDMRSFDSYMCLKDALVYDDGQPVVEVVLHSDAFAEAARAAPAATSLPSASTALLASSSSSSSSSGSSGITPAAAQFAIRQHAMMRRMMLPAAALRGLSYRCRLASATYRSWRNQLTSPRTYGRPRASSEQMELGPQPMSRQVCLMPPLCFLYKKWRSC